MRVGVDVVHAHPGAEITQRAREIEKAGRERRAFPRALGVLDVEAVGAGVLADDQQFLDARFDEPLGLGHDVIGRPAREAAAQRRNDAERAAVVTTLGDFQVRVVPRRQAQALRRHEVEVGVVQRRHRVVHRFHDASYWCGPVTASTPGMRLADHVLLDAEAAGDDDAAVLGHRFADRVEAFLLGGVEKAAGVDDDDVGAVVVRARSGSPRPAAA